MTGVAYGGGVIIVIGKVYTPQRQSSAIATVGAPLVGGPPPIQAEWKTNRTRCALDDSRRGRSGSSRRRGTKLQNSPESSSRPPPLTAADLRLEPDGVSGSTRSRARARAQTRSPTSRSTVR